MYDILKRHKYPFFIVIVSLIFLLPLFKGFYLSHDGEAHVARFAAMYQAFIDGQFPPRWAGSINHTYGNPALLFFYPLPDYLAALLHFIGLHFEQSFVVLVGLSFIGAPLTFYFWAKTFLRKEQAFVCALLYSFAPYHFLDLYVRGDTGELLAFVLLPLVFLAIDMALNKKSWLPLLIGGLAYGLFILSHNALSLLFTPVLMIYTGIKFFPGQQRKYWARGVILFIFGFGISAFFWLPALLEKKYTHAALFIGNTYQHNFPSLLALLYSRWGFGPDITKSGGLSPQIGIIPILIALVGLILWIRKKNKTALIPFWFAVAVISIFLTTSFASFIWAHISLLRLFEFPWRLTSLTSFAVTMMCCYTASLITNKKILFSICMIFLLSCFPFLAVKAYVHMPDTFYIHYPGTTYYYGEASSLWTAGDPSAFPIAPVQIIAGKGTVLQVMKKSELHTYVVNMQTNGDVIDNTTYFPGWRVYVDKVFIPIQFQDPNHRGLITFPVPKGRHRVEVIFKETYDRLFADGISLVTLLFIIFAILAQYLKKPSTRKILSK